MRRVCRLVADQEGVIPNVRPGDERPNDDGVISTEEIQALHARPRRLMDLASRVRGNDTISRGERSYQSYFSCKAMGHVIFCPL